MLVSIYACGVTVGAIRLSSAFSSGTLGAGAGRIDDTSARAIDLLQVLCRANADGPIAIGQRRHQHGLRGLRIERRQRVECGGARHVEAITLRGLERLRECRRGIRRLDCRQAPRRGTANDRIVGRETRGELGCGVRGAHLRERIENGGKHALIAIRQQRRQRRLDALAIEIAQCPRERGAHRPMRVGLERLRSR